VVTLKNLSIEGISSATYGVRVTSVAALHIEHCVIAGFQTAGVEFNAGSSSSQLFIDDLAVRRSGTAVNIVTGRGVINRLAAHANTNGVFLAGSGVVLVRDSAVTASQMGFAAAYDPTAKLTVENSVASDNLWGVVAGSGATVRLFNVSVTGNSLHGLYNDGTSFIVSMGQNTVTANGTDGVFTSTLTIR